MLLHLNFCIEWFDSNSKENSKSFGKCCEKKKKRKIFLFSAFDPAQTTPVVPLTTNTGDWRVPFIKFL
jgi:hypothetical protein